MRNVISMLAGAAFVVSLAMPAFASDMTVKGEVVDALLGRHIYTQFRFAVVFRR